VVLSLDEIGRVYSWRRRSGIAATRRTRCHGPTLDETTRYSIVVASSYTHYYPKMYSITAQKCTAVVISHFTKFSSTFSLVSR
jgi:hypothetical protein